MNITELVEVVIGLAFVWLALALACSGAQEWIASILKFRSRDLEKAIRRMLEEPEPQESRWFTQRFWESLKRSAKGLWAPIWRFLSGKVEEQDSLTAKVYKHPLIKALTKNEQRKPSYIPDHAFAMALFDVITTAGTDDSVLHKWTENLDVILRNKLQDALGQVADLVLENGGEELKSRLDEFWDAVDSSPTADELLKVISNADTLIQEVSALARDGTAKDKLASFNELWSNLRALHDTSDTLSGAANLEEPEKLIDIANKYPQLKSVLDTLLKTELDDGQKQTVQQIAKSMADLSSTSQAIKAMAAYGAKISDKAEKIIVDVRTNVETWYNDSMARLSGSYKRRSQSIGLVIGVILAIIMNVDSIVIATSLWREPLLREAVLAKAAEVERPAQTAAASPEEQLEITITSPATPTIASTSTLTPTVPNLGDVIEDFDDQFQGLQIPIGWVTQTLTTRIEIRPGTTETMTVTQGCVWPWSPKVKKSTSDAGDDTSGKPAVGVRLFGTCWVPVGAPEEGVPTQSSYWLPKILGWVISGMAAAMGAPFWFDVLKRLTNVRLAGKNPDENKGK